MEMALALLGSLAPYPSRHSENSIGSCLSFRRDRAPGPKFQRECPDQSREDVMFTHGENTMLTTF